MVDEPRWFALGDRLLWPVVGMGLAAIQEHNLSSPDLQSVPYLALCHHAGCLQSSMMANEKGKHSAAICLVRQSVEALTLVDIGLQEPRFAEPLLSDWKEGKKSHGQLRSQLEREVWPRYGKGIWDETWSEFYANLAKSVQPYAHYTAELQGWQLAVLNHTGDKQFFATYGLETYDPLKATRITLLHIILTWMLGRILLSQGGNRDVIEHETKIHELGQAIANSNLLFHKEDWWVQLAPHMIFRSGYDWRGNNQ